MNNFEEALADASKSIEISPEYSKAYLRKAKAERELLLNEDSLKTTEEALKIDSENEAIRELYEE